MKLKCLRRLSSHVLFDALYSLGSFTSRLFNAIPISISAFASLALATTCWFLSLTVLHPLQYGICKLSHLP